MPEGKKMSYYLSQYCHQPFEKVLEHVRTALSEESFGVLMKIDVKATLKKKLDVDFRNYRIWGPDIPNLPTRPFKPKTRSVPCCPATW